jgi:hypothetical protein
MTSSLPRTYDGQSLYADTQIFLFSLTVPLTPLPDLHQPSFDTRLLGRLLRITPLKLLVTVLLL